MQDWRPAIAQVARGQAFPVLGEVCARPLSLYGMAGKHLPEKEEEVYVIAGGPMRANGLAHNTVKPRRGRRLSPVARSFL